MRGRIVALSAWTLVVGLVGCDSGASEAPAASQLPAGPPFAITASIQDLMVSEVDPSADYLWESVGTIVTASGTEERRPRTDEEWQAVRVRAVTLAEAGNLLMMDGRSVAEPGKKLEDEGVEGILTAAESQQAVDDAHPTFVAFALALHDVGKEMLTAIDARDVQGMLTAGEELDAVCESCHIQFWYPNQVIPVFPDSLR